MTNQFRRECVALGHDPGREATGVLREHLLERRVDVPRDVIEPLAGRRSENPAELPQRVFDRQVAAEVEAFDALEHRMPAPARMITASRERDWTVAVPRSGISALERAS